MTKCERKNGKKGRGNASREAMIATKKILWFFCGLGLDMISNFLGMITAYIS